MQGYQIRRVLLIIAAVIAVVFIVSQVASLFRRIAQDETTSPNVSEEIVLTNFEATDSYVRLTYDGPVVAREDHRAIRITVTPEGRTIEVQTGYSGSAARRQVYLNDRNSYAVFIRALHYEGFAEDRRNKIGDDERGVCSNGTRTIIELYEDNEQKLRLWSADCDEALGTLAGDSEDILDLFQKQIPTYDEITEGIRL